MLDDEIIALSELPLLDCRRSQVDTACTAGLTACHIACGAVKTGECEFAIAAGVNMNFFPDMFAVMNGFKEHQGRCYSFDHRASG